MRGPVRDALKEISENSWLIDDRLLLRRLTDAQEYLWKDGNGWYWTVSDAPTPLPEAKPLSPDSPLKLIYDVAGISAVFDLGGALLKAKKPFSATGINPEHVTLRWLAERKLSFPVPKALHYTETNERIYSIVSRVPGKSIDEAWRGMSDQQKHQCVSRVADICQELSAWTSDAITGLGGARLFDVWLDIGGNCDLSPENLLHNCKELQMDVSTFVFNHNDLGPTNVMVDVENNCEISIIDWEMAGYVPSTWVRTKLLGCFAMDFCWRDVPPSDPSMEEWRKRVAKRLGDYGFSKVHESYCQWSNKRRGLQ